MTELDKSIPAARRVRTPWTRARLQLIVLSALIVALFPVSLVYSDVSPGTLADGLDSMRNLLARMYPPRFGDISELVGLALETLMIAIAGTAMAVALSIPLAFAAARNTTRHRHIASTSRAVIVLTRAIPDLVFALIFVRALGLGPLPGVLAIGFHSIGMLGKVFADSIEEIDPGPLDAVRSAGATQRQTRVAAVLPQVLPSFIGMTLYRLDINVRASAILGLVGAGGIGTKLSERLGTLQYERAFGIIVVIFLMIVAVEKLASSIRQALLISTSDAPSTWSARLLGRLGGSKAATPSARAVKISLPWSPDRIMKAFYLGVGLVLVGASVFFAEVRVGRLIDSPPKIWNIVSGMWPPDFSRFSSIGGDLMESFWMAYAATFVGVAISLIPGMLGARNLAPTRAIYNMARYFVVLVRGIPHLIWALLFVSAVGLGPFAGTMALLIGTVGITAKFFMDSAEEIDEAPREAVAATGASGSQVTSASVVPQVLPAFIASSLYTFDINLRASVILGIVGAGGIGFKLLESVRSLNYDRTAAIMILVYGLVLVVERISGWIRKQLIW